MQNRLVDHPYNFQTLLSPLSFSKATKSLNLAQTGSIFLPKKIRKEEKLFRKRKAIFICIHKHCVLTPFIITKGIFILFLRLFLASYSCLAFRLWNQSNIAVIFGNDYFFGFFGSKQNSNRLQNTLQRNDSINNLPIIFNLKEIFEKKITSNINWKLIKSYDTEKYF
jgi:hypothetical protein